LGFGTGLVDALSALPRLDSVQRAGVCPMLIDAAKTILAGERNAAMLEATDRSQPDHVTQVDLAGLLGVTRTVITDGIRQARHNQSQPAAEEAGTTETEGPTTAEFTCPEEWGEMAGEVLIGDVVKANKSTVYVKWRHNNRIESVSRRKPLGVILKP
jgi:hypothetical protein